MDIKAKKGEIFLVKGESDVIVKEGAVESVGALLPAGEGFVIPYGKTIPIEIIEDADLKVEVESEDMVTKLDHSTIPDSWIELYEKIKEQKAKRVIVLGEVDTGKSFFSTYLANKLYSSGLTPAVIDCDIGQSDVGAPGTMGLTYITRPTLFLPHSPVAEMYFVGSHSANLHFLPSINGFEFLLRKASEKADVIMVNTSGWVQFDGGRAYKRAKMEIMDPDIIVLLQRETELEHLVKIYDPEKIFRIKVSKKATSTPPSERKALRELVTKHYLEGGKEVELDFSDFETERVFFKTGTETKVSVDKVLYAEKLAGWEGNLVAVAEDITEEELKAVIKEYGGNAHIVKSSNIKNALVGLTNSKHHLAAMGTILDIDFSRKKIKIYTTANKEEIKIIQFGSLKVKTDGSEAGFIEPGYL